jgi:uncharacterized protein (TIGR00255 family)
MVQSMTGYGTAVCTSENYRVTVELKSLNSKYFELGLKVPRPYMKYEHTLRNYLTKELERGKITMLMNVEIQNPTKKALNINVSLLKTYWEQIKSLHYEIDAIQGVNMEYMLSLPQVMDSETSEGDEEEWALIEQAAKEASKQLTISRLDEGKALDKDFEERLTAIETLLAEVEKMAPTRAEEVRKRLKTQLEDLPAKVEYDANRLEQELIFYLEKLDVNEEIVRLRQHLTYFREVKSEEINSGKQLNFIAQEMGREINTIGSKANDAKIQHLVVKMKDELEKIKEQTMNIV